MSNEEKAIAVGQDRKLLLARLKEAKSVLKYQYRQKFKVYRLDFANKRLIGSDGFYLQWRIRPYPDRPASYENQQTSRGSVTLESRGSASYEAER